MLTPEKLHELLECDPEAGTLTWKERPVEMFTDSYRTASGNCANWNSHYSGEPALASSNNSTGYSTGTMLRKTYQAHRVIWAMVHGEWPVDQIDHINGIKTDNRIENLRSVTRLENMKNCKTRADNTSGRVGVYLEKGRWRARIKVDCVDIHLGIFTDLDDAIAARAAAEIKYGFHANHGRVTA